MKTVERQMQSDLIDCSMNDFIGLVKDSDKTTLLGMLGVLRADYQQLELAIQDLRNIIQEKDSFTEDEKSLHIELASQMVNIEERCRLILEDVGSTTDDFIPETYVVTKAGSSKEL